MERRTYTVAETAEILGVSTDVVYRMKNDGILPAVKNLSAIRFLKRDVLAMVGEKPDDFRPSALRRLRNELALEKQENERLRSIIRQICIAANTAAVQEDYEQAVDFTTALMSAALVAGVAVDADNLYHRFFPETKIVEYRREVRLGDTLWTICGEIAANKEDLRKLVWQAKRIIESGM